MHFESPWALLLLLLIPVLLWRRHRHRSTGGVRFSSIVHASQSGRSLRQRLGFIAVLFRVLALVLLAVALARPRQGIEQVRHVSKGIAIEMVLDRSSSMGAEMVYQSARLNRLEVVKRVFQRFVLGNGRDLKGRPNDLVGMVAFARFPDTLAPLTLAHGALPRFLEGIQLVTRRAEDGTAIGDGIALAAARLKTAEEALSQQTEGRETDYTIKSKIIILLTDGENNAGQRAPMEAARLAADWGIKIYTIGVGGGDAVTTFQTFLGAYKVPLGQGVDEGTLKAIAAETGGIYRRAEDAESLEKIYEEIDELEQSEIESMRYVDYKEWFTPFALAALLFLLIDVVLNGTLYRKIP